MFAKLCAVDLRPAKFAGGRIAQIMLARMRAIVIRDDQGGVPAYHLLGDSAAAEYLCDCLTHSWRNSTADRSVGRRCGLMRDQASPSPRRKARLWVEGIVVS